MASPEEPKGWSCGAMLLLAAVPFGLVALVWFLLWVSGWFGYL